MMFMNYFKKYNFNEYSNGEVNSSLKYFTHNFNTLQKWFKNKISKETA